MGVRVRPCGDCAMCCTGTLEAVVNDTPMYPGNPCHYTTGTSCTIYNDRPQLCIDYRCEWLNDESLPAWLQPHLSRAIVTRREIEGIPYIDITEVAGSHMTTETLSYLLWWAFQQSRNVRWFVGGGYRFIGTPEFCSAMEAPHRKSLPLVAVS